MAIGPKGEVTTTGLMNSTGKIPDAPDMSNLKAPAQPKEQKTPKAAPVKQTMVQRPEPKDSAVMEKLNALSEEEKVQLDMVLSPSLSNILKKISPDASSVIDQFTSQEENVILPVSVVKNYAMMKYPSSTEQESVQGFVTELSESQSDDTNNVPPENMQASNPNPTGMMAQEPNVMEEDTDAIDQGLV
ncbi:hypothetical protein N9349_05365 [Candidatus Pelagibacter sp.]|nr:hypothetical protein [Candidatus Pelagibacter sp.]